MSTTSERPSAGGAGAAASTALRWQTRRVFLVGLAASAGWLDALAFLHLGKVFISFMSGNLLFVGIAAGNSDASLFLRAGVVLVAFLVGTAGGARMTGSRLVPGAQSPLPHSLLLEAGLLAIFALLWLAVGNPEVHSAATIALLVVGAAAMGLQAALALAFHLPNVATVAMTATLAQLAALIGWREREGESVVAETPSVSLMIALCLSYVISAGIVAAVPESSVMAFGPVVALAAAIVIETMRDTREGPAPVAAA
jgi:uncharacterized membrane protein YoaK (UPF0700 family)